MPQLHFVIRQANVSNMIGSGGVTVKGLENETNTKINLQNDTGMLERDFSKLRCVCIRGEKEDLVKGVVKVVSNTLTLEHDSPFMQLLLLPGGEIEQRQGLMGQSELTKELAKVNEESSARVKVVSLGPTGIFGIEILSTTDEEMKEAVEKVTEIYEKEGVIEDTLKNGHNRQEILHLLKGSLDDQIDAITTKETVAFLIPEEKTSLLIGSKGTVIKEFEETHSVRITVEKPNLPSFVAGRAVLVRGEVQNIAACFVAVMEKIFEREDIELRVVCLLPAGVPKYLIGYSGETIKRVEQETGCQLQVVRVDIQDAVPLSAEEKESRYCQISGERDNLVRGILGVVVRILFQLKLQGQTSEGTIPAHCDFGKFGKSGLSRGLRRFPVLEQQNVRVTRPIRESYVPNIARGAVYRAYKAPIERSHMFDVTQSRHVGQLGSTLRRQMFSPDRGYKRVRRELNRRDLHEPRGVVSREIPRIANGSRSYGTRSVPVSNKMKRYY